MKRNIFVILRKRNVLVRSTAYGEVLRFFNRRPFPSSSIPPSVLPPLPPAAAETEGGGMTSPSAATLSPLRRKDGGEGIGESRDEEEASRRPLEPESVGIEMPESDRRIGGFVSLADSLLCSRPVGGDPTNLRSNPLIPPAPTSRIFIFCKFL